MFVSFKLPFCVVHFHFIIVQEITLAFIKHEMVKYTLVILRVNFSLNKKVIILTRKYWKAYTTYLKWNSRDFKENFWNKCRQIIISPHSSQNNSLKNSLTSLSVTFKSYFSSFRQLNQSPVSFITKTRSRFDTPLIPLL